MSHPLVIVMLIVSIQKKNLYESKDHLKSKA